MAAKIFEVGDVLPATAPQENTYLTFQSISSFTLKVYDNKKHWDGTLYYSTDTTTWNVWDGTTTLSSVGNKLYLRGTGNTKITGDANNYRWVLTGSNIECTGNIENLLDWEAVESGNHPSMASYCYAHLFRDCTALTSAPALPSTTLAASCYRNMFRGCTALTSAPALPAPTLADYCYAFMFQGCTALTSVPALPATTLASSCYYQMFEGCTSLTTAPSLPATTLATDCYYSMFNGCTSLTTAPRLPATTLTSACYRSMFQGCTSLTTAPSLPATTLAFNCYQFMFKGCTSLTTAPSLSATTLTDSCYYSMFEDCTSLTTVPSLPATTLATDCYRNMFRGCTAFKVSTTKMGSYQYEWRIPTSGTGTVASNWNIDMLYGTGGTFTDDPTINKIYYVENPPVVGFNITFEENGGITIPDIGGATKLPSPLPIPTKENHTFLGWYYDSDFTTQAIANDEITENVTLYAKWQINTYTVTFYSNGGSSIPSINDVTELPNPLPIPTKDNHIFLGWYYDSDFTNEAFADDPLTSNVTLYAKWELNTYTITYNSNGGSSISQTSNVTQLPSELPIPTKARNTFVGWYYDSTLKQKAKPNDMINTNITLYAKWYDSLSAFYTDIANLIREFENSSDNIKVTDFADRLRALLESV